jgi:signal peptidase II
MDGRRSLSLWRTNLKKHLSDYASLFLVAGTIVFLDQATKYLVRTNLALGEVYRPDLWITEFARIVYWQNTGAAFGMFQSLGNVFMILSMIVSLAIIYYYPQVPREDRLIRLAMAMLLGGAVGNLIDRLYQGYVTDFFSFMDFPVFNIADACISLGVVVLFIGMWLQEREKKKLEDQGASVDHSAEDKKSDLSLSPVPPPEEAPGE